MAITLSDVVVAACNTAAGLSYHSDPDEAPAFGRTFLELVSDDPEEIRQYHDVVIEVRDVRAGSCLAWALDQAKKGALADVQSRMLLYTGAMYGLLGDSAPRRYWPEHLEVPIALDRDVWAETLYWAYAVANDERRVVEWQLCRMCGVACFIEMDRRLARIIRKGSDFGSQDGVIVSRTKDRTLPLSSAGHVGRKIGRMARCERPAGQLRRGRSREAR